MGLFDSFFDKTVYPTDYEGAFPKQSVAAFRSAAPQALNPGEMVAIESKAEGQSTGYGLTRLTTVKARAFAEDILAIADSIEADREARERAEFDKAILESARSYWANFAKPWPPAVVGFDSALGDDITVVAVTIEAKPTEWVDKCPMGICKPGGPGCNSDNPRPAVTVEVEEVEDEDDGFCEKGTCSSCDAQRAGKDAIAESEDEPEDDDNELDIFEQVKVVQELTVTAINLTMAASTQWTLNEAATEARKLLGQSLSDLAEYFKES